MKRWSSYLFITLCALFLLLAPVYAQKITGTISGTVTDPSGAVVPNATVTITNIATGLVRTVTTSDTGNYMAPDLPNGTYRILVKVANFKEVVIENVEL